MENTPTQIASQIRSMGFRMTPQRMEILAILSQSEHLTPPQIHAQLVCKVPGFTEPTLYRTLDFLCKNGFVQATHVGNGKMQYELTDSMHHHTVCKECGQRKLISSEIMQVIYDRFETETGFKLMEHHLTLNGLCPDCK